MKSICYYYLSAIPSTSQVLTPSYLTITSMAALLRRVHTSVITQLSMANLARIRTVEEDVGQVLVLISGALEGVCQIRLREAYTGFILASASQMEK